MLNLLIGANCSTRSICHGDGRKCTAQGSSEKALNCSAEYRQKICPAKLSLVHL